MFHPHREAQPVQHLPLVGVGGGVEGGVEGGRGDRHMWAGLPVFCPDGMGGRTSTPATQRNACPLIAANIDRQWGWIRKPNDPPLSF